MPDSRKPRLLLVDDEVNVRKVLGAMLTRDGYDVVEAADGEQAFAKLSTSFDVMVTDLKMPHLDGMGLLRRAVADFPEVPVIMITAHGSVDSAVEAVKLGAFDYIEKPFEQEQIRAVVQKAFRTRQLQGSVSSPDAEGGRFGLIGVSEALKEVFAIVEKVADTPSTVLITGESGTGKELVARALHEQSIRKRAPFIKINCAAIPKTLIESELFGYEKGAFTRRRQCEARALRAREHRHAVSR